MATWLACLVFITILITVSDAASSTKNLTCYFCHTLTHGSLCQHVFQNAQMVEDLPKRHCANGEKHCIVRRYAYAPNGTDTKVWMMERNCSRSCTSECVITGDRMKLHLCTSCCHNNLCNVDNAGVSSIRVANLIAIILIATFIDTSEYIA